PNSSNVLYLGTGDDQTPRPLQGVARSTDSGATWTFLSRFTNQPVCTLAVDPSNSARVFAGSSEGLFLSADAAATWSKVLSSPVTSVAFDGPTTIYAGILGGDSAAARDSTLLRSVDGGRTWTNLVLPLNPSATLGQTNWVSIVAR